MCVPHPRHTPLVLAILLVIGGSVYVEAQDTVYRPTIEASSQSPASEEGGASRWDPPEWFEVSGHIQGWNTPFNLLWEVPPLYKKGLAVSPLLERPFLIGDPCGARSAMSDSGFLFTADYTQFGQSVVDGGISSNMQYGGKLDGQIIWDAARANVIKGGFLQLRYEARYGQSTNTTAGVFSPPNIAMLVPLTADDLDSNQVAITDLFWVQSITPNIALLAGKVQAMDSGLNEFASGRGVHQFMNAQFVFNNALISTGPYSALAAGAIITPTDESWGYIAYQQFGEASTLSGFNNFDNGWLVATEWYQQYRLRCLPGGFNAGYIYAGDADLINFQGKAVPVPGVGLVPQSTDSTWATWFGVWQYVHVAENIGNRPVSLMNHEQDFAGIGVWARFGVAEAKSAPYPIAFSAGLGGKGTIAGRENDTWGIGYSYLDLEQGNLLVGGGTSRDRSHAFEGYYNVALTPSTNLTFDLQALEAPVIELGSPFILGARFNIAL